MIRSLRFAVLAQAALLTVALVLPGAIAASSPASATLTILDASCSGAPGTVTVGATVCARAVVTIGATGAEPYRTYWYGPGALTPTYQDVHPIPASGTVTFEDTHQLTASGVWTVRACKNATCVSASSIAASRAFMVAGAPATAPTSLAVAPASGTYAGSTSLAATLTTSGGAAVTNATVAFTLGGSAAGSAVTDAAGVATLAGVALAGTGAGSYPSAVGASFAGTSTLAASSAAGSLTVGRASSTTTVSCPANVTFTGDALTPCSAAVTGAGLDQAADVAYADNVDAGTAGASAAYAGDTNHEPSAGSASFTVDQAASTVALTCPAQVPYTGAPQAPCSGSVTGAGGLDQAADVTYANNVLGTATATAAWDGDRNHAGGSASATFEITFVWFGFDDPIEAGKGYKAGRTIPLKFSIGDGSGQVVQQLGSPTFARSGNLGSCAGTPGDAAPAATSDAGLPFKWTGGQYHYNWSTRGLAPGLYRLFAGLGDGSWRQVDVCLSK